MSTETHNIDSVDREIYEKIPSNSYESMREDMCVQIGHCEYLADNGDYKEAYQELNEQITELLDRMNHESELHFE